MKGIFDTHAHYTDKSFETKFDGGASALLSALYENGVDKIINVGTNTANSAEAIEMAKNYEGRLLQQPEMQSRADIPSACSVWKMKDMPAVSTTRQDRTTGSFPLPSMDLPGASSTLPMYITMSTVSYSTPSIHR